MWYLFIQIWVWLVVAFVLGWSAHWFLCCRNKDKDNDDEANSGDDAATVAAVGAAVAAPFAPVDGEGSKQ